METTNTTQDYLAPGIGEVAQSRGGPMHDPNNRPASNPPRNSTMTRSVAKRLLPACVVVPAVLWGILAFGHGRNWFDLETSLVIFVFSVAAVFGLIVCLNLKRLSRLDAERQDTEEQLKLAKEAAENANRFKSAFFANISHEIRTPLTAINGFAELLLNPRRSQEERLEDAKIIRRNGEHLLTLINDILDLSRIEAGRMSVERILCAPAQIVGEVCLMLRHRAAEKKLKLDVQFEGSIPRTILTDPTRLRQILINLISNSIKFTKSGSVKVTVAIRPCDRVNESLLEVRIADTGIGIAADRLDKLFQPFVQADTSITRQYGGSGLGLAISRHFSRALGGDITVTSEAGKGSMFIVTVETGSLKDAEIETNPQAAMELKDHASGPQVRIKGSILVAEDGIDNQALIATRLRQAGLSVEIAPNGKIACEKALAAIQKEQPYDLILMDVQMPVMDGFTATLNLRGKGYRAPIIALTANAMERDRNKCLNAGCNDFVTKPIHLDKLFAAIGKYLPIEQVADDPAAEVEEGAAVTLEDPAEHFRAALPEKLSDINEAIERQDRTRVRELIQLILGKAAAAGLKDVSVEAARLLQLATAETSWTVIQKAVNEFASETQVHCV